jgi:hypothetical protein
MRRTPGALLLLALLMLAGCASAKPPPDCASKSVGISLPEAEATVAAAAHDLPHLNDAEPLKQPKSLDDVEEILKRDDVELFPAGVAFAATLQDTRASALRAQIELAWGEALEMTADLFGAVETFERSYLRDLEARNASGEIKAAEIDDLVKLRHFMSKRADLREALGRIAAEHVGKGAVLAREIIAASPESYLGYRLAADYYRLRGNWPQFDQMVKKIEATNPASNGLVFLKAMNEIQRAGHVAPGSDLLRQALQKDPKFVRAESELVLASLTLADASKELKTLQKLSPHHQLVIWVGPAIDAALARDARSKAPETVDVASPI